MKSFIFFLFLLQGVASLSLTLQSTTFARQQSLLIWERQPIDGTGALDFNLRFVQGTDQDDVGSAASEVHASSSKQSGSVQVVFPKEGSYGVIAVDDSGSTIGTSNNVLAIAGPSISPAASSSMLPSASSTSRTTSPPQQNKVPVIVGSVIGSLVALAVLAALFMILIRRRRRVDDTKRWTFHRHMMIQPQPHQQPKVPPSPSSMYSASTLSEDPEQGLRTLPTVPPTQLPTPDAKPRIPDPVVYPTKVAGLMERRPSLRRLDLINSYLPQSPMGPRAPIIHPASLTPSTSILRSGRAMSPIPRSPSPRTHRQRAIADQIEILRVHMLEAEREGVKDHIGMSEMSDKMTWLREQQEGPWALGLTEVTPLGYDRYMSSS